MHKSWAGVALAGMVVLSSPAIAQKNGDNPATQEIKPPPFDAQKVLRFKADPKSAMSFGIDPATITKGADGEVRYVVVAQSPSGSVTAMYEGLRCNSEQFMTYARANGSEGWKPLATPEWRSIFDIKVPGLYPKFLNYFVCNPDHDVGSVADIVYALKSGTNRTRLLHGLD